MHVHKVARVVRAILAVCNKVDLDAMLNIGVEPVVNLSQPNKSLLMLLWSSASVDKCNVAHAMLVTQAAVAAAAVQSNC